MKRTIILCLISFSLVPVFGIRAQGDGSRSERFTIQANLDLIFENYARPVSSNAIAIKSYARVSGPGIQLGVQRPGGNWHQFSIGNISFDRDNRLMISDGLENNFSMSTQYEYRLFLFKKKFKNIRPFLGIYAGGNIVYRDYSPGFSTGFPFKTFSFNLPVGIMPGLRWDLGKVGFAEFSIPLEFISTGYSHTRNLNPTVPVHQQNMQTLNFYVGDNLLSGIRFGGGIYVGKLLKGE